MSTAILADPVAPAPAVTPAPSTPVTPPATPVVAAVPDPVVPPKPATSDITPEPNAPVIDKVSSIDDVIAVKLGQKVLKKTDPAPAATPDAPSDDAALDKEIEAVTAGFEAKQREAFKLKTYELRDAKRKLKEAEAAATRATELEAKVKEYEAKLADATKPPAELEELKTKLTDYERELSATRIERTEKFRKEITEPLTAAQKAIEKIAKGNDMSEGDTRKLVDLLSYVGDDRNRKIAEAMHDLNELDKHDFVQALKSVDGIHAKRDALLANAKVELETYTAEQQRAVETARAAKAAELKAAAPVAWEKIKSLVPGLAPVEGNDAWNAQLTNAERFADHDFTALDATSQATVMQRAGAFPLVAGLVKHLDSKVAALEADLAKLRGAAPGADIGRAPAAATVVDDGLSVTERINRRLKAAGVA